MTAAYNAELAGEYFAEAIELARELDDRWRLSQILAWQANAAIAAGDPIAARVAAEEGRDLADAIGDRFNSRQCRMILGLAQMWQGDLAGAVAQLRAVAAEAKAAHDGLLEALSLGHQGTALAWQGDTAAARAAADASLRVRVRVWRADRERWLLRVGERGPGRRRCRDGAGRDRGGLGAREFRAGVRGAPAPLLRAGHAGGRGSDRGPALGRRSGRDGAGLGLLTRALTARARVAIAQGEPEQAERDAHDALAGAAEVFRIWAFPTSWSASPRWPATPAVTAKRPGFSARQRPSGSARAWCGSRSRTPSYEASVAALRDAMGENDFDSAWAEGAALSTEEAIAYAQRGRGQRKRPTSGWASLTPTERDVVRLVSEGLTNNDIATRLFVSPRTVQTHLTHVYAKLGLTSRVQLVQEAARHLTAPRN